MGRKQSIRKGILMDRSKKLKNSPYSLRNQTLEVEDGNRIMSFENINTDGQKKSTIETDYIDHDGLNLSLKKSSVAG